MKKSKNRKLWSILLVALICFMNITISAVYIYWRKSQHTDILTRNVSENILGVLGQNLITVLPSLIIFAIMLFYLKKDFAKEMYLKVKTKKQMGMILLLVVIFAGMLLELLRIKEDKVMVLYGFFYYLFFIAFLEEFVIRDVCVYIMKDFSTKYRYLIPNILFALMHIFSYSDWNHFTMEYVLQFLVNDVLGLVVVGCMLQLLKEKTGTIWIPVLLHAIADYSNVFEW